MPLSVPSTSTRLSVEGEERPGVVLLKDLASKEDRLFVT